MGSIRTCKLNEHQTPIMNTKSLILIFSLMLLSIGAMPQEAPPGAEEVAPLEADVAGEAVETERQGDIGEAPPGAEDLADEAERDGDEEDEELDEDEPEEDEAEEDEPKEEDATEDKEEEDIPEELAAAIKAEEDKMKEASDKSEEPIAPVSEVKAEV